MQGMLTCNIRFRWYKLLLFMVEAGLLAFGFWAFLDSVSVGASHAAYRFLLLFAIWSLPGWAVLAFVRPGNGKEAKTITPIKVKQEAGA
ncbi:MAG: hypothetical protein AAGU11_12125 [Syntrophobacteraceae bacterium]